MDRKRYGLIKKICCAFISIFLFLTLFFIWKNNISNSGWKKQLTKSITLDQYNVITIVVDNSNKAKRIGEFNHLDLVFHTPWEMENLLYYEKNDVEIIIKDDLSDVINKYIDNEEYLFRLSFFGGNLRIRTIYKNGQFEILNEYYSGGV